MSAARSVPIELEDNWKQVLDTFLETYHFNYEHKNNLSNIYNSNINTAYQIGKHLRIVKIDGMQIEAKDIKKRRNKSPI